MQSRILLIRWKQFGLLVDDDVVMCSLIPSFLCAYGVSILSVIKFKISRTMQIRPPLARVVGIDQAGVERRRSSIG